MDLNKLRTLVFEKTGIRIDTGDPVFALVALNEAVLSECIGQQVESLHRAADALRAQSAELTAAGERYRSALQELALLGETGNTAQVAAAIEKTNPKSLASDLRAGGPTRLQWLLGALGISVLSAALTLAGAQLVRTTPSSPPPPKTAQGAAGAAFTPEQTAVRENAEKLAKAWPRLDAATQAKITRALQEP